MSRIKFTLLIATIVAVCNSEPVNISGAVVDSAGNGIAGAKVLLEKANISVETNEKGLFTLTGTVGVVLEKKLSAISTKSVPFIENGRLNFSLDVETVVGVAVYSFQGRIVYKTDKKLSTGSHTFAMPVLGDGVYLCRVKVGGMEYSIKGTFLRNSPVFFRGSAEVEMNSSLGKIAKKAAVIDDILTVRKEGFLDNRMTVSESAMEMPVIKMIVNAGDLTDIDGNVYQTVRIGSQVWMAENLRVTRYNDNTPIDTTNTSGASGIFNTTALYLGTTNADSARKYGFIYTWYVISPSNPKKIAPTGWHVPNMIDWDILENYLIANGYNWDGTTTGNKVAKSMAAKTDWKTFTKDGTIGDDLGKNNTSGFSALPNVYYINSDNHYSSWWCATEESTYTAWDRELFFNSDELTRYDELKAFALAVRLVKD